MTLIIILIGLAVEHFVGVADELRRFAWFERYLRWLENRLADKPVWQGGGGVLITLLPPLLVVALLAWGLTKLFLPLGLLFALLVFIYSLGPRYLNPQLDELIDALDSGDNEENIRIHLQEFAVTDEDDDQLLLENVLIEANERLFGVLFWFIILGPLGAVLYRLSCLLWRQQSGIHGNFAESCGDLYNILNWPVARLIALGNALTGNMVEALETWRELEKQSLSINDDIICGTGLAAINYQEPAEDTEHSAREITVYWLQALQGLLNRNLLAWLMILALMTLSGWLA